MDVIGNGFVAGHLRTGLAAHESRAVVIAAGVSSTSVIEQAAFDREARLVEAVLRRCATEDRPVVLLSTASSAMYGAPDCPGTEDEPVTPTNAYGEHKLALERTVGRSGVPHVILRVSHLVGEGQREHQLLPGLVRQIRSGVVTVQRGAHRDLLDVRHLTTALGSLLSRGATNVVVNACSGIPQPIPAVVSGIEQRLGLAAEHVEVPGGSAVTASTARLRELVPETADFGFDATYLPRLLDRYVPTAAPAS